MLYLPLAGYSVSVGERGGVSLYFTGAPRFQHTGQVVLFIQNSNNWITAQRITGDQVGYLYGDFILHMAQFVFGSHCVSPCHC